jgi:6-phosphogluconolactonase (cycloisomerase 2 family)
MTFSSRIAVLASLISLSIAHQAYAVVITDTFDRSNGNLGSSWATNIDGGGSLRIIGNRIQPAAATYGESLYTASSFGGPQFSEVQHISGLATGVINLVVRAGQYTGGNLSDSYRGQLNGLTGQWRIIRVDNNVEAVLATGALSYANGDTFAFSANGTALTLSRNGATLGTANDSRYSSGAPGVGIFNKSALLADNWRGGDYTLTGGGGGGGGGGGSTGTKYTFFSSEAGTPYIASYRVGATGGFTQVSALSVGTRAKGVAVTPSGGHVIVAVDPSNTADGELRVYSVSGTGQLALVSRVPMGPGTGGYSHTVGCGARPGNSGQISCGIGINSAPETVLIHPNGRFVYVMDGVAGGACTPAGVSPCTPANGGFPAAGNRVIVRYTFNPATGALTYQDQHYVEGFMSFAMDPFGRFVWGTSYLERRIYEFRIDQSTGALTFGTGTYIGMSNGSMWLGIESNGRYAYAAHAGDRTIDSYTINQTTGHLTNIGAINGSCSAPANCNKVTNVSVSGLVVSADGRTLYGASSRVVAYALGTDGRIGAPLAGSPFGPSGSSSRALVGIGSAGQYLYLQRYSEAATRVFSVNTTNGALTESSASPTALAGGTSGVTAMSLQ